ncbi:hypothetical protein [Microbacterium flavum]|uniref:hypothetical protein n=1 Tax=Microbacterium flavum TaxID=415216 RepID=UPI0024AD9701|nr:hypothetical protein [Microbacterium flavum]
MASRTRWALAGLITAMLILTGCSSVNEDDLSERLTASASIAVFNGATVEVQHPGAPWTNKFVVRVFVDDESAEGVAAAVRQVAIFAAGDSTLDGEELTVMAYPGFPEDYADGGLGVSYLPVMGSVSAITGGVGREGVLELSDADVQRLAAEQ